jgi:NDP-sugar pyrophosphorylase family protein
MQCVILAGGLATRMRPLTQTIPKALIPVGGVPFIDHQLTWLAAHGVTGVVLSIGYRGDMLRDHVGDGARFGLEVRVVDEGTSLRGTAGALRLALDRGVLDEAFLVTYGDSFLPIDFADVWRHFRAGAAAAPALMTVFHNAGRWDTSNVIYRAGRVELYDKHHATRPAADFDYIDYGLSAMKRSVIEQLVPAPRESQESREAPEARESRESIDRPDLAELFHALSRRGELAGYEVTERFFEIGSPAGLEDFERWIAARA